MKLKAIDEHQRGKHLRDSGCACPERLVAAFLVRTWPGHGEGIKLKAIDERQRGKHLRVSRCACPERLVAALDLRLFQRARGSGTRVQGKHKEDDSQHVELVHFCECGW